MKMLQEIREIYRSLAEFEKQFEEINRISLNEALILSTVKGKNLTASQIAKQVGMTASNTSKVIKNIESKWLIERNVGKLDRREMYFNLTKEGDSLLNRMSFNNIDMAENIETLINK